MEINKGIKATVKIEDSKGTREYEKEFRNRRVMQDFRINLRDRVETGSTISVTEN